MTAARTASSVLVIWESVPTADCYVATMSGHDPVALPASANVYNWLAQDLGLDLTKRTVAPTLLTVTAFRARTPLKRLIAALPCPTLIYLAARGSGQNGFLSEPFAQGLGDRGRRVYEHLRDASAPDLSGIPAMAVDYPAVAVAFSPSLQIQPGSYPAIYAASVHDGVADAVIKIAETSKACPSSRFILFGYSQGAQVIGDAFSQLNASLRDRVARVILFADAAYAPADHQVRYRPSPAPGSGIKAARGPFPTSAHTVIESWCWSEDVVCQGVPKTHFHGDIYDDYENSAAAAAISDLS